MQLQKYKITYPDSVLQDFQGSSEQILTFYHDKTLIVLVGLGVKAKLEIENLRSTFNTLEKFLGNLKKDTSRLLYIPEDYKLEDQIYQILIIKNF